ncbi:MAG: hypothetical protein ACYTFW_16385 [Planctomycetota bacterium]|jgi:hypothetical protein
MKERILVSTVILLAVGGMAQAQEGELHGVVDLTYQSKYIWRGFDIYGDKSAIQPSIDLDLFGTGLGMSVMGHRANSGGFENLERWDYMLYYDSSFFEDKIYVTMTRLAWVYYNYPDHPEKGTASEPWASLQEIQSILSWPKILPIEGLVPSFARAISWPSKSGSFSGSKSPGGGTASGTVYIFMLDYDLPIQGLLPDTPEQTLHLHSEAVYNDGMGPAGQNVDHDWSHAVFGASTNFDLSDNLTLTPGLYHQITMDSSVNDDKDETWLALSMAYKF